MEVPASLLKCNGNMYVQMKCVVVCKESNAVELKPSPLCAMQWSQNTLAKTPGRSALIQNLFGGLTNPVM